MLIAVLNGPNLNLLGEREPEIYGQATLGDIERAVRERGEAAGATIEWVQSNHEGELIDAIHGLRGRAQGAIVNAAALAHTSLGLRDALLGTGIPFIEVHLSNVFARERVRRHSFLSDIAIGVVAGLGPTGYVSALDALVARLVR